MKTRSIWLIDVCGAAVTAVLFIAVGWYAFLKPDTATSRMHALSQEVNQLRGDLGQLQSMLDVQTADYRKLLAGAEKRGRLPTKSPVEEDLRAITALAYANDVNFTEVAPLSRVRYPNLLELRYRIKAVGTYANQLRFLKAFEQCSAWADVTYMKMDRPSRGRGNFETTRHSDFTVSFFSAVE